MSVTVYGGSYEGNKTVNKYMAIVFIIIKRGWSVFMENQIVTKMAGNGISYNVLADFHCCKLR